jgi:ubiquinone/menaquinone biosynthesis C-methylase UbiE
VGDPQFRRDLFRGTARDYDEFRVNYPPSLTDDLARRSGADGQGRLLDLACGTGQLAFALHDRFGEVWAADQEPDMIQVVAQKATAAGIGHVRLLTSPAEDLALPGEWFDLVTIGNAFHRLPRQRVASSVYRSLRPGGFLALAWCDSPWRGDAPWQQALSAAMKRWRARADAGERVPAGYDQARSARPDQAILGEAGFEFAGRRQFSVDHEWTPDTLVGFLFSTSVLSRLTLGGLAADFESDIHRELHVADPAGRFRQAITFAYDLFRRPPSDAPGSDVETS